MMYLPAAVIVADRVFVVRFSAAEYRTLPSAIPVAPDVMASHEALLFADQAHPLAVLSDADPEPPFAPKYCVTGDTS